MKQNQINNKVREWLFQNGYDFEDDNITTYFDIWLWLYRFRNVYIRPDYDCESWIFFIGYKKYIIPNAGYFDDMENALITSINYIIDNNIKIPTSFCI